MIYVCELPFSGKWSLGGSDRLGMCARGIHAEHIGEEAKENRMMEGWEII